MALIVCRPSPDAARTMAAGRESPCNQRSIVSIQERPETRNDLRPAILHPPDNVTKPSPDIQAYFRIITLECPMALVSGNPLLQTATEPNWTKNDGPLHPQRKCKGPSGIHSVLSGLTHQHASVPAGQWQPAETRAVQQRRSEPWTHRPYPVSSPSLPWRLPYRWP